MTIKLDDMFTSDGDFRFSAGKYVAFGKYRSRWDYRITTAMDIASLVRITDLMAKKSTKAVKYDRAGRYVAA